MRRRHEARTVKVAELLERARDGELRIPTFQRPFRWRRRQVLDLLDSVYRGYPIGELLFSRQSASAQTGLGFGPYRVDAPAVSEAWFVVDGQQRITALVGSLMHPQSIPRTSVCAAWFDLEAERFVRLEKGAPPAHWIPVRAVKSMVSLSEWLDEWPLRKERPDLVQRARELQQAILDFEVPAYVVDGSRPEVLKQIFRRVNTAGAPMGETEVFDALYASEEPQPIARACLRLHEETSFGVIRGALFLRALKAVQSLDATVTLDDHDRSAEMLSADAIPKTEAALRRAIEFLQEDGDFPSGSVMPYLSPPLIILARFFSLYPSPQPRTRLLLRFWVWRGALSKQHASSSQGLVNKLQRAIDGATDEFAAARALLRDAPPVARAPTSSLPWNPANAEVRACMAALLAMVSAPLDAANVEDVSDADDGATHDPPVFASISGERPGRVSEAFVSEPGKRLDLREMSEERRRAHFITPEAFEAYLAGDTAEFFRLRGTAIDSWLERYFRERCGDGETDAPPVSAIAARVEALFARPAT